MTYPARPWLALAAGLPGLAVLPLCLVCPPAALAAAGASAALTVAAHRS